MSVFDVLNMLRGELPGFVSSSVVGLENGLQLACVSAVDPDDSAAADAFHSDVEPKAAPSARPPPNASIFQVKYSAAVSAPFSTSSTMCP